MTDGRPGGDTGAAAGPLLAIAAIATVVIIVATVAWRLSLRDTTTPVAVTAPGPGVYVYTTTGHEEIDALGGARHDYPAETVIQIGAEGCGLALTWQPLEERFDRYELCNEAGELVQAQVSSFHRWFGRDDLQEYACAGEAWLVPPDPGITRWSYECATDDRTEAFESEVVGSETLTVAGTALETLHVRTVSTLTGATEGESLVETWWSTEGAIPVRVVAERSSRTGSLIGDVSYTESYELDLTSVDPVDG